MINGSASRPSCSSVQARRARAPAASSRNNAPNDRGAADARSRCRTGYAGGFEESARQVVDLEKAGLDIAWVAEAYGFDGVSFMGYLAAKTTVQIGAGILPIYTRTPTLIAMTAAGIDALSGGRCVLGLGVGPAGDRGLPRRCLTSRQPARARSSTSAAWCGSARRSSRQRPELLIPVPRGRARASASRSSSSTTRCRSQIPIYIASLGEKNVELTAEVADGWLPFFACPRRPRRWSAPPPPPAPRSVRPSSVRSTRAAVACSVRSAREKDVAGTFAASCARMVALYVGGMGAKGKNFYNALVTRYGYEQEAAEIQDLYLAGKKEEAAAKVPGRAAREDVALRPRGLHQGSPRRLQGGGRHRAASHARRPEPTRDRRQAQGVDRVPPHGRPARRPLTPLTISGWSPLPGPIASLWEVRSRGHDPGYRAVNVENRATPEARVPVERPASLRPSP